VKDVWDFALTDEIVDHPVNLTIDQEKEDKR
jgi:ATP-dependent Lon protease